MAITLPVFLFLFFGIIHVGLYIYNLNVATTAASMALDSRIGLMSTEEKMSTKDRTAADKGMTVLSSSFFLANKDVDVDVDERDREIRVTVKGEYETNLPFFSEIFKKAKNIERSLSFEY